MTHENTKRLENLEPSPELPTIDVPYETLRAILKEATTPKPANKQLRKPTYAERQRHNFNPYRKTDNLRSGE